MDKISDDVLASIVFSASYQNNGIQHTDCYYGQRVNMWRDILPPPMEAELYGKKSGDQEH